MSASLLQSNSKKCQNYRSRTTPQAYQCIVVDVGPEWLGNRPVTNRVAFLRRPRHKDELTTALPRRSIRQRSRLHWRCWSAWHAILLTVFWFSKHTNLHVPCALLSLKCSFDKGAHCCTALWLHQPTDKVTLSHYSPVNSSLCSCPYPAGQNEAQSGTYKTLIN